MKNWILGIIIIFGIQKIYCQEFDREKYFESIKEDTLSENFIYKNIDFITSKDELLKYLGDPDSIVNPNYECGGFAVTSDEIPYLQYFYSSLNFIGREDSFMIELINFERDTSISINYKGIELSYKTELIELKDLFPKSYKNRFINKNEIDESIVILPCLACDDKIFLRFQNGLLKEYDYWSPC